MERIAPNTRRFAKCYALIIAAALYPTAGFALGTDEQRAACTPDVFRLCASEIPNVDRIVACLRKEKPHLSAGCQAVFNAPQQRSATRSLANPESEWCEFGKDSQAPQQENWLKWCGSAAHRR